MAGQTQPIQEQVQTVPSSIETNESVEFPAHVLPAREYLGKSVLPAISQGLKQLVIERPEDPFEYLALYLLEYAQKMKEKPSQNQ